MFAEALRDITTTLVQYEETDLAEKIEKFIADLTYCTECELPDDPLTHPHSVCIIHVDCIIVNIISTRCIFTWLGMMNVLM